MAMIGNLLVKLGLNSAIFDRNIKKSRQHLTGFEKGVRGVGRTLARLAGPMAAAFGAYKIAQAVSATSNFIDRTSKLADQLGISVTALSSFNLAAELSGTKIEVVAAAMQTLQRRLGEAKMGTGEAIRGLEKMNLTAEHLAKMPLDAAFERIADGIMGMTDSADRALTVFSLFGRQGQELIPLLEAGGKGIRDMRREAVTFRTVFSRLGAAAVVKMIDAVARLREAFRGVAVQAAIILAPAIERMATAMAKFISSLPPLHVVFSRIVSIVQKGAAAIVYALEYVIGTLSTLLTAMSESWIGARFWGVQGGAAMKDFADTLDNMVSSMARFRSTWLRYIPDFESMFAGDPAEGIRKRADGLGEMLRRLAGLQAREAALAGIGTGMGGGAPRFAREIESERFNLRALQLGAGDTIPQQQLEELRGLRSDMAAIEAALEKNGGFPE